MTGKPISAQPIGGRGARIYLFLFFVVFLAVGGMPLYFLVARPVAHFVQARSWDAVPCEIISSEVHENHDSDGRTYRVDVRYRYIAGGAEHVGDRYKFLRFSSSGRSGKARTVAYLRANPRQTCWVNPMNPADAVLERTLGWEMLFGLILLVFFLIGLAGVYAAIAGRRTRIVSAVPMLPDPQPHAGFTLAGRRSGDPAQLKPTHTRRAKLIGFTLIALFWNGIVGFFLAQLFAEWTTGVFSVFMTLFLVPFVLVGAGLAVAAVYVALQLTNPRPLLTVSSQIVPLGDELEIQWLIDGPVEKLARFSVELEGREEATYRRGTTARTDKQVFERIVVTTASSPVSVSGSGRITIPAGSMHSFETKNNRIVWALRVRGVIPKWPDVDDEFAITVAPKAR